VVVVRLSKISAVVIGIVAIYLGYVFENQNVAFMVGLRAPAGEDLGVEVVADRRGAGERQAGDHGQDGREGYVFENQNVAFMVGLAFAVAASCNFPVLAMSILTWA
jgi:hypothetical protein